jgi:outer membrane protein assembly factor BamB
MHRWAIGSGAALLGFFVAGVATAEWPQWRGPTFNGASPAVNLPVKWSDADIVWKVPLPGRSGATPAVWGDKIFVSAPDGKDLYLFCIDSKGTTIWKEKIGTGNKDGGFNGKNNFATPSPITDGQHVWILVGSGDLACFTMDGTSVWKRNLIKDHGKFTQDFGIGCTPLLWKDRLIFPCIHRRAESYLLAIDKNTGADLWKVYRPTTAKAESRDAYSSPAIHEYPDGRAEIIISAADFVSAHDPKDGKETWRHGDLNLSNNHTYRIIVSPVSTPNLIYACACKGGPFYAITPGGSGDVTKTHRKWTFTKSTPDVATPAVADGLLYLVHAQGRITCLDAETGHEYWHQRIADREYFGASPVVADGKVYLASEAGKVHVLKAGKTFEELAVNDVVDPILATPAPADGRLYLRTSKALICVGK